MSKSIISAIAFATAFGGSVLLVGLLFGFPSTSIFGDGSRIVRGPSVLCTGEPTSRIEYVLAQDIRNSELMRREARTALTRDSHTIPVSAYARMVADYAEASGKIDAASTPADFQRAWRDHMNAWRDYSRFLNGDAAGDRSRSMKTESDYDAEISRTWYIVLASAERHEPGIRARLGE